MLAGALVLAACGDTGETEDASRHGRLLSTDAPLRYLPGPHNCPEGWSFISDSTEDDVVYIANYKRKIPGQAPDYLTIRVELCIDIPASISHYQLLKFRFIKYRDAYMQTVEGLGERSVILTVDPRRILFQRANAIMEVEAERLGTSAMLFAKMVDQRLLDLLEREAADTPARPADNAAQAPPP